MGETQYRATEVAKALSRYIKADLPEELLLAMINRKFPGLPRAELLRVLAICQDEVLLDYERAQDLLASMRETTAGCAALFALVELWRSHSEDQRSMIRHASSELANTLDRFHAQLAASAQHTGWNLFANFTSRSPR